MTKKTATARADWKKTAEGGISVREASKTLGVSENTVRKWFHAGKIKGHYERANVRIDKADAAQMLALKKLAQRAVNHYLAECGGDLREAKRRAVSLARLAADPTVRVPRRGPSSRAA